MSGYLSKSASTNQAVPTKNSTDNLLERDVIGNKTDDEDGNSLYAHSYLALQHIHSASYVYPTLAAGVTLTATNDDSTWTPGALTQVIPASTVTSPFDIHFISIESLSANTVYQIAFYYGAGDTYAGSVRVTKTAAQEQVNTVPLMTPLIPANSRIRATVATPDNNGETVVLSVFYHIY